MLSQHQLEWEEDAVERSIFRSLHIPRENATLQDVFIWEMLTSSEMVKYFSICSL